MKNRALPRSLKISIAVIVCLNILVFFILGISVNNMSESTIEKIGTTYMAGMNKQVSLHFETIIDLRLTMAESIAYIAADEDNSGYATIAERVSLSPILRPSSSSVATVSFSLTIGMMPRAMSSAKVFCTFSRLLSLSTMSAVSRICATV